MTRRIAQRRRDQRDVDPGPVLAEAHGFVARDRVPSQDPPPNLGFLVAAFWLVMMIIAVAWFVAGIVWADRIFFYPPILFVIGIVAIVKGLMGGE